MNGSKFFNNFFCVYFQGPAVETEECGGPISNSWECIYGATGSFLPSNLPSPDRSNGSSSGNSGDPGSDCRCGCIVHLSITKPNRIIAASAQSCPGRTFWLLQADSNYRIRLVFDFFGIACSTQYVRIRDGDSLAKDLIGEYFGGAARGIEPIITTGPFMLVEFYSNELSTACKGGFLSHAQQIRK